MKFSIILCSRGRVDLLSNFLYSVEQKTLDLSQIEVKIGIDNDDIETKQFLQKNPRNYISWESAPRERRWPLRANKLAKECNGQYILIANDDAEIITDFWDAKCFPLLEQNGPIIYGSTECNSVDHGPQPYSSFPIISKAAIDTMGCFFPEYLAGLGGDVLLYRIFAEVDRIVKLPLQIRHILHEKVEYVLSPDTTAAEMREVTYEQPIDIWNVDLSTYTNKLKDYIYGHSIC